MQDRVYNGLRIDGPLLLSGIGRNDRREIFRRWEREPSDDELPSAYEETDLGASWWTIEGDDANHTELEDIERWRFESGIRDLLAFLYLGIEEGNLGDFEDLLKDALSKAADESGRKLTDFDLTVEMLGLGSRTPEAIAGEVRSGGVADLTLSEIKLALEKGALDPEEAEEALEEWRELGVSVSDRLGDFGDG